MHEGAPGHIYTRDGGRRWSRSFWPLSCPDQDVAGEAISRMTELQTAILFGAWALSELATDYLFIPSSHHHKFLHWRRYQLQSAPFFQRDEVSHDGFWQFQYSCKYPHFNFAMIFRVLVRCPHSEFTLIFQRFFTYDIWIALGYQTLLKFSSFHSKILV